MRPKKKPPSPYAGQRVLVVGLGLHGGALGAIRWLHRQRAVIRVTDRKTAAELAFTMRRLARLPITYHLGRMRPADFRWADTIYQNQDVPSSMPELVAARHRGVPIVNETTLFFQHCPAKIIGVTGTRGKSTTTALIRHILAGHFPRVHQTGNLRQRSMLDVIDQIRPADLVVVELSSFQLDFLSRIRRSPSLAVLTNLSPDHLNRHGSMQAYARAKENIFRWQKSTDVTILNADNAWTRRAASRVPGQALLFSAHSQSPVAVTVRGGWIVHGRSRIAPVRQPALPGTHNLENMLAAVTAAIVLGVPAKKIRQGLTSFKALPHRLELVRRWRGHAFINDTTATSPVGMLAALRVYPRGLYIVGGTDKQLEFGPMAQALTRQRVPTVWLPGTATDKLQRLLRRQKYHARHHLARTMAEAVHAAIQLSRPGQPIILSPGAASFGLFVHEFDRGEQFRRIVNKL